MIMRETMGSGPQAGRGTMTANRFRINLGKDAVKLALDGEWSRAAEINRAILELYPDDCEASNRLAKALMELADYPAARLVLDDLRTRHPSNNIARKNLVRLETLESAGASRPHAPAHAPVSSPLFIEEGGKSCATTLRRTGGTSALADVAAGDTVTLSISDDTVAVHSGDGLQLGTVEPRLARRLRKLIAGGNQYSAAVVSIHESAVSVVIRETQQHPSLRNVVSFPPSRRDDGEGRMQDSDPSGDDGSEGAETSIPNVDAGTEAEQESEDALPGLATDEIDDDDDADESSVGVPVLDTDDVDNDPILAIVPPQPEDDWE